MRHAPPIKKMRVRDEKLPAPRPYTCGDRLPNVPRLIDFERRPKHGRGRCHSARIHVSAICQ